MEPPSVLLALRDAFGVSVWRDHRTLVAVSAGPDSMALVRCLWELVTSEPGVDVRQKLVVAHFNHQWRGDESDADQQFVESWCAERGISCEIGKADPEQALPATAHGNDTSESAARHERYGFLIQAARQTNCRYVLTAHTMNDQAETVLHHLVRGTGLDGLKGIVPRRLLVDGITLVRPLLGVTREEIEAYLALVQQSVRVDRTNHSDTYTRNRIRQHAIPWLQQNVNEAAVQNLARFAVLAGDVQSWIGQVAEAKLLPVVSEVGQVTLIHAEPLVHEPRWLVCEMMRQLWRDRQWPMQAMTYDHWQHLALIIGNPAKQAAHFPGGISVTTADRVVSITKL